MSAFQPSLPLSRTTSHRPNASSPRRPPSATAAMPRTSTTQLEEYEAFLRTSPPRSTDAPVYQTAEGALVCEWSPPKPARQPVLTSALLHVAEYEKFLSTTAAKGVDMSRPVYVNHQGNLVCHLPEPSH